MGDLPPGRSLSDLLDTIQHLEACGVDLYLDQQAIDTTTPMGKLVFQLTGAFAEFERTMIRQRVKAGLKRAVAQEVAQTARPKVPMRWLGADCSVVVRHRLCRPTANETLIPFPRRRHRGRFIDWCVKPV
jgi:hypothetical protein